MTDHPQNSLLVHICCAPCAEYPLGVLGEEGFSLRGYFYNPNIHPLEELVRRREGVQRLMRLRGIPCDYDDAYLQSIWEEREDRHTVKMCALCYEMRMKHVAAQTRLLGMSRFTTTLLVSPYQQHDAIRDAAERAAAAEGVEFYYHDFRPGFRIGQAMAREDGLYRQKYCGCIDSLESSAFRDRILQEHSGLRDRPAGPEGSGNSHR